MSFLDINQYAAPVIHPPKILPKVTGNRFPTKNLYHVRDDTSTPQLPYFMLANIPPLIYPIFETLCSKPQTTNTKIGKYRAPIFQPAVSAISVIITATQTKTLHKIPLVNASEAPRDALVTAILITLVVMALSKDEYT
mgnify:CR=1 FL=1